MYKTIRRDWLKRQIALGNMIGKCNYSYTDDYRFDNENNFGETDWFPAAISNEDNACFIQATIKFDDDDFKYKTGRAWYDKKTNTYTLYIHSNCSFAFKFTASITK